MVERNPEWNERDFLNYSYSIYYRSGKTLWTVRCWLEEISELVVAGLAGNILPSPTGMQLTPEEAQRAMEKLEVELKKERENRRDACLVTTGFDLLPPQTQIAIAQGVQELLKYAWEQR